MTVNFGPLAAETAAEKYIKIGMVTGWKTAEILQLSDALVLVGLCVARTQCNHD